MKEIKQIIAAYDQALITGKKTSLATVVHLDGSSYRRPGARMLVEEDGLMTGAISGGCLEGDALRRALLVMVQQQSKLITYDSTEEEDAFFGAQLGCEGIIQVLFEPIDPNDGNNPISLMKKMIGHRQQCVLVTLFDLHQKHQKQIGTCLLVEENEQIHGQIEDVNLENAVKEDARQALKNRQSLFINYQLENISITGFIKWVSPPLSVVIAGAGNDVIPLVNMIDEMGWEAHVVDGRNNLAKRERFVNACQVLVSKPEQILKKFHIDDHTAFLLMTHNYQYDLALLKHLVAKNLKYLGVLGPKKKMLKMYEDLAEEGIVLSSSQKENIYAPIGLEIGAETPEEIALSILAELKAVFSNKKGGLLRDKDESIHSRKQTEFLKRTISK